MKKLPTISLFYWIMIISANTIGESGGDLISQTTGWGYGPSTLVLLGIFAVALIVQLAMKIQHPVMYWIVIILTSTAGTTMSDLVTREWFGNMPVVAVTAPAEASKEVEPAKLDSTTAPTTSIAATTEPAATTEEAEEPEPYADYGKGVLVIASTLLLVFVAWRFVAPRTHVNDPMNRVTELLYWAAILTSSTLGTAFGDYIADEHTGLKLGFGPSTLTLLGALAVVTLLTLLTKIPRDICYWAAIVVTHPLGATAGDLMTKDKERGGLGLGNVNATLILTGVFILISLYGYFTTKREQPTLA